MPEIPAPHFAAPPPAPPPALPPGAVLGYCTNVHAGTTLEMIEANLDRYAVPIRQQVAPDEPLGVGLWLPASAAAALAAEADRTAFRARLEARGLRAFTFNGFPYGDFHRERVKHAVYRPSWAEDARLTYTQQLIEILAALLEAQETGSISTLPIGWPSDFTDPAALAAAADRLLAAAEACARCEAETGRCIHLDLEPEPGCVLGTSDALVRFFETRLLGRGADERVRRYLRVCHDVSHAAVMFEAQEAVLERYERAGIRVGKIQLASALGADFGGAGDAEALTAALTPFAEPRYLHQVSTRSGDGPAHFYEDLPAALAHAPRTGTWRIHYHVPVNLAAIGPLATTRPAVLACLAAARRMARPPIHYEVETYAWEVLPAPVRRPRVEGIAEELSWVRGLTPAETREHLHPPRPQ